MITRRRKRPVEREQKKKERAERSVKRRWNTRRMWGKGGGETKEGSHEEGNEEGDAKIIERTKVGLSFVSTLLLRKTLLHKGAFL
jgi:hypothetical protein